MKKSKKYIYTLFISFLFFNIFSTSYAKQYYTVSCPELVSNRNNIEDKYHLDFEDKIEVVEELSNQISKTIRINNSQKLYTYFYNDLIDYNIYADYQKYLKDNNNITKVENNYVTISRLLKHQKKYKDFFDEYTKDFSTDKETDKEKLIDIINYFLSKDIKYDYENPNNNNEVQIQTLQENKTKCHGGTTLLSYLFDKTKLEYRVVRENAYSPEVDLTAYRPGHIFNEVKIEGTWYRIDATEFMDKPFKAIDFSFLQKRLGLDEEKANVKPVVKLDTDFPFVLYSASEVQNIKDKNTKKIGHEYIFKNITFEDYQKEKGII